MSSQPVEGVAEMPKRGQGRRTKKLEPVSIRLDSETLTELRQIAQEKGIGPTTLARMCLLEHLQAQGGKNPFRSD